MSKRALSPEPYRLPLADYGPDGPPPQPAAAQECSPPDWVQGAPLLVWEQIAPRLIRDAAICNLDAIALGRYCSFLARWLECGRIIAAREARTSAQTRSDTVDEMYRAIAANEAAELGGLLDDMEREFFLTRAVRDRVRLRKGRDAGHGCRHARGLHPT